MKDPFLRWQSGEQTPHVFAEMCLAHDLTYALADDPQVRKQGGLEKLRINEAAATLGLDRAAPIWNAAVRRKLHSTHTEQYTWPEPA